jgi:hypothetical protein
MKILTISHHPRRESHAKRKAKSSRATEQGVAGHQAAMKALGTGWGSFESAELQKDGSSVRTARPRDIMSKQYDVTPGRGHVNSTEKPFEKDDSTFNMKWINQIHWGTKGISKKDKDK